MTNTDTAKTETPDSQSAPSMNAMAAVAIGLGWLVPGAGHLMQKKWIRGLLLMSSVATMFFLGLAMNGKVYKPNAGDLLDMLGFVGDLGAGGLYLAGRAMEWGDVLIAAATADYGTKFIVVAGLLNVISVVDAYHIAIGKKQ
ncbi:MAG TPA: DUF6677 family protein [Candidatus Saccharimonadales bacterium]|jgi:hypothetical protein|nr:DUF6677 family protein [Candidatus Saccharimonadales bacterium]